jgi:5,10-methylene-tetrahydrofolate dehydrogenase/methenyl tetrahydrofolate cyclohydrolase
MGRKRKANLEVEYELERQVEDLKQEVAKLKKQLKEYEREDRAERREKKASTIVVKKEEKECPKCGAKVNVSELPMGYLELCASACGYRAVTKKK